MEHQLRPFFEPVAGRLGDRGVAQLCLFASLVLDEASRQNLTGHKTIGDIIENLIIKSLLPFRGVQVPRGTLFFDLGSGAGVPGIPLSVLFPASRFVLIDSDSKKMSFVATAVAQMGLSNVELLTGRVEELVAEGLRASADWVVSRAMASEFVVIEMGAPLLKKQGLLYLYAHKTGEDLGDDFAAHAAALGLVLEKDLASFGLDPELHGILYRKRNDTPSCYPRRYPVIKREAERLKK